MDKPTQTRGLLRLPQNSKLVPMTHVKMKPIHPMSRSGQFVLGFVLMTVASIPNHIWHYGYHPIGVVLVMSAFGWLVGKRVHTPLASAVWYNLAGLSFPFFSILGTFTLWMGAMARQGRLSAWAFAGVNVSLLILGGILAAYTLPTDLYLSNTRYPAVDARGIPLQGLNTPDIEIASGSKAAYVFDFWNTRCGACYAAKPHLLAVANKWAGDSRVLFGSVSSSYFDSLPAVLEAEYLHVGAPLSIPEYFDSTGRLAALFAPAGCPVIALVDAEGHAVLAQAGYSEMVAPLYEKWLDRRIREMLN